nr:MULTISPECIES: contractile injection system tape measure protein [unclassified Bradyrhizobium]
MPHVIGRQHIDVEMADDQGAPDLLDRIGELNRVRFLPTIERVLTEFDRSDTVIRIDGLDLKLGTISADDLDGATQRLETSLREALSAIVSSAAMSRTTTRLIETTTTDAALLQALAGYLRTGTWPYRQGAAADPIARLVDLVDRDPDGVRRLIVDAMTDPDAAERLALQLTGAELRKLLGSIFPARARAMFPALPDGQLDRATRLRIVAAIADAIRRDADIMVPPPGPFDTPSMPALSRSLPVIDEGLPLAHLDAFLQHGMFPHGSPDALLLSLADREPLALIRMLHQYGRDHAILRRLAETLSTTTLARLLQLLTPAAGDIIVAHMTDVRGLQRQHPVVSLAERNLERLLWFVALRHVLNDAGTQFNRKTFVAHMIAELAGAERVSYRAMLEVFASSLANLMNATMATSSLAVIILELADAPEPHPLDLPDAAVPQPADMTEPDMPPAARETSTTAYRNLDRLRHLLTTATLPWPDLIDEPTLTPERLIDVLRRLRPGFVLNALRGARLDPAQAARALARLPATSVASLLQLLQPPGADPHTQADGSATDQAALIIALIDGQSSPGAVPSIRPAIDPQRQPLDTMAARLAALAITTAGGTWARSEIDALLQLAADDPRMARRFLARTIAHETSWARLTHALAPAAFHALLRALAPGAAATLIRLAPALVAARQRGGGPFLLQDIASALLAEVVHGGTGTIVGAAWLQRVLGRLMASSDAHDRARVLDDLLAQLPDDIAALLATLPTTDLQSSSRVLPAAADNERSPAHAMDQHSETLFQALASFDLSRAVSRADASELLNELTQTLLAQAGRDAVHQLLAFLVRTPNGAQLIQLLPERQLALLIMRAQPHAGADLLDAAELLTEAAGQSIGRTVMWQNLIETATTPAHPSAVADLTERLLIAAERGTRDRDARGPAVATAALARTATGLARAAGHASLGAALNARLHQVSSPSPHAPALSTPARQAAASQHGRTSFRLRAEDDAAPDPIFIANAGLVLTNPFLPHLFETLGLITRDEHKKPRLRDEAAASRAVHLLQYLVDGRTDTPEPLLTLNKALCGLLVAQPIERAIIMTDHEQEACDMLLRSILANWPILSGTSIAGLREAFLQRDGKLIQADGAWRLQVQRKTLDVLVDQIPWSIGVVFHAWMPGPLHVTW